MTLGLNGTKQNEADAAYRSLRIIWLAILMSVVTIFVITRLVQPLATRSGTQTIFWMLMALGLATFAASFVMKQRTLKQAAGKNSPGMVRIAYIIAFAFCEATALFGMAAYFATGVEYYYFFFVLSGFGQLLHKPQRDDFVAATGENNLWK
ncbi:MAG TPA: hypothetical protein VEV81_09950 [Pyrinomonadaceae bacterium]|nr:hypothetical protein [Pyrinomonadaceae bacterium]